MDFITWAMLNGDTAQVQDDVRQCGVLLRELSKDRERLDWFAKASIQEPDGRFMLIGDDGQHYYGATFREAIDAARKATK
jgi:hypothetical protein